MRALTAEELQQFLDAHHDQPAQQLGSGWASLDPPPGHPSGVPRNPSVAEPEPPGPQLPVLAGPAAGRLGSPGRSALARYRRQRTLELAAWAPSLAWRGPLVVAAGVVGSALAGQAGLARATLAGLAVAALVGGRLRCHPSDQARTWQRGAHGERRSVRLLDRLPRDGYVVFHDLALPGSPANVDHLVIGPSGVFVIDSKQWTGQVYQSSDGLVWHNHFRLDRTLETVRWEALTLGRLLGIPAAPLLCVHGAHVPRAGLCAQGVTIVPAGQLHDALGHDQILAEVDVELLAATARSRLHPAI